MKQSILILFTLFISSGLFSQSVITVDGIWSDSKYYPARVAGVNFYTGDTYTKLENNKINQYSLSSGKQTGTIFDPSSDTKFGDLNIGDFKFLNEQEDILFISQKKSIYRHSYTAKYQFYDKSSETFYTIGPDGEKVMYADLSPVQNMASYVYKNNIYLHDLDSDNIKAITSDGNENHIINGASDWVYEEEFKLTKSYEWSPDGKYIAYLKFDETEVPEFTMEYWTGEKYPRPYKFKYPKVGEKNSEISLHIYNISDGTTSDVDLNAYYIPRIQWTPDGHLLATTMNRHQNDLMIYKINPTDLNIQLFLHETNKAYIDVNDELEFLDDGTFFWFSEKDGWNHLYLMDQNGNEKASLTSGEFDVTDFYGYDKNEGRIYYQAAAMKPMYREIYSAKIDGTDRRMVHGGQNVFSAQYDKDFDNYILRTSSINRPTITAVYNKKGEMVRMIEDNQKLVNTQNELGVNKVEFFDFVGPDNITLYGWMIKPDNFDENKEYPVLMYQYGGPNSQQVNDRWKGTNYWWFQMLADKGYFVVCVDNRGTGARGEEFRKMTYLQLGKYETEDQIATARYMAEKPFIDGDRIGIWGWSYGGFMAANAILKGNDVFSLAISVAPVTNWKWYDTVYTERYMRTDEDNKDGYEDNSPVNFADRLKGDFLLIHGMADDNVHFQHSIEMANALILHGKQFETYFYPNRNHGIYGGGARAHLYHKMTNFIEQNL